MAWYQNPDWWAAIGTIGAVVVALFGERLKRLIWPPRLRIALKSNSGEATPVGIRDPRTGDVRAEQGRYYHLSVSNRGSPATNVAVYLTGVMLRGAGNTWYPAWKGEAPFFWRHGELYPLLRPVGFASIDADFFEWVKGKWIDLRLVIRPNAVPGNTVEPHAVAPGRWRAPVEMILTVQAKATEGQSPPYLLYVDWKGGWSEGETEILRLLHVKPIAEPSEV